MRVQREIFPFALKVNVCERVLRKCRQDNGDRQRQRCAVRKCRQDNGDRDALQGSEDRVDRDRHRCVVEK